MKSKGSRSEFLAIRWFLIAVAFAATPVVVGLSYFAEFLLPGVYQTVRALLTTTALTALAFLAVRFTLPNGKDRLPTVAASWFLVSIWPIVKASTPLRGLDTPYLQEAIVFVAVVAPLMPTTMLRMCEGIYRALLPPLATAAGVVGALFVGGMYLVPSRTVVSAAAFDQVTKQIATRIPAQSTPDVYQIVLDGFGRPDVLESYYGLSLRVELEALRRRGFEVQEEEGIANYTQTFLSLASMLNANYLDPVVREVPGLKSRQPLRDLMDRSSVIRAFKAMGYHTSLIGAGESATASNLVDDCDCEYPLIGSFESVVLDYTVLRVFRIYGVEHRSHRHRILRTLRLLGRQEPSPSPKFVIAHIMAAHVPFVFGESGEWVFPQRPFALRDGSMWLGSHDEYVSGYTAQATYVLRRVIEAVDAILAASERSGRESVIIIHGDHGPRLGFDAVHATKTDASEVVPILLAIRWAPTSERARVGSLVNVYRALMRRYFGAQLGLLPDRAEVSSFLFPYRMVPVSTPIKIAEYKRQGSSATSR